MNDTQLLDFLDSLPKPEGSKWILRKSETGRGYRLHHTSRNGAHDTVREAIKAYLTELLPVYACGIDYGNGEYGMWHGPFTRIGEALVKNPNDFVEHFNEKDLRSVIIKFQNSTDKIIFEWDRAINCYKEVK